MINNMATIQTKKLEEERAHILEELGHLYRQIKAELEADIEGGDPELIDRDMTMSLIRVQERKLDAIDQALYDARLGLYGICERCRQPIDPERLEALPEATLCVACKRIVERTPVYIRG